MARVLRSLTGRLTYANVMSTIAVFVALGGGAYAAFKLPSNSVGTKQIKNGAVTARKLGRNAVTGSKVRKQSLTGREIKAATLANVPSATHAASSDTATSAGHASSADSAGTAASAGTALGIAAPEGFHVVGSPGEPEYENSWAASPMSLDYPVGFYKDREGVVHMRGVARGGEPNNTIFHLPPGYRPAADKSALFAAPCDCTGEQNTNVAIIGANGAVTMSNGTLTASKRLWFDGITFRAES